MERKHHSPEEISHILQDLEGGMTVDQAVMIHGVSKATLYRWRKRAQGNDIQNSERLSRLHEENGRLKNLLADAALEIHALKEQLEKEK